MINTQQFLLIRKHFSCGILLTHMLFCTHLWCILSTCWITTISLSIFTRQAQLHLSWWDGPGKDHPVHYIPGRDVSNWHQRALPHNCPPVYYCKLGARVSHLDPPQRHCLPWKHDQQADVAAIWDVFQGCTGKCTPSSALFFLLPQHCSYWCYDLKYKTDNPAELVHFVLIVAAKVL